jgi:c-di-GMP-binding flagellar brake protein YcgR
MDKNSVARANRRCQRRRQPRRSTKVYCRAGAPPVGPDLAVSLLDISATGIRLVVSAALEPGEALEVGLEGHGRRPSVRVAAEVVWALETVDGSRCVGARFLRRIGADDLHALAFA